MLNFATVGSSWITDEYIRGAKDSGYWSLTAVYSRTYERGRAYAERHGADLIFTDIHEMAQCEKINAVYIANPNYMHYEHCKIFLENKKHVICEKPISAKAAHVQELQAIAKQNNVIFMEAIMFLHLPQLNILNAALEKLGPLSLVKIDFCQRSSKLDDYFAGNLPNIFNPKMETGAFMDLGIYCVYPVLYLFGQPETITADSILLESKADAAGIITMKYPDKLVTVTYSKIGQAKAGSEFQGRNGTLYVDSISRLADITYIDNQGKQTDLSQNEEKFKLMGYEAKDFYRYITEPEKTKAEYQKCSDLALEVSSFMENTRKQLGIVFPSDK